MANVDPDSIGDRVKIEEINRTLENDDEGASRPIHSDCGVEVLEFDTGIGG